MLKKSDYTKEVSNLDQDFNQIHQDLYDMAMSNDISAVEGQTQDVDILKEGDSKVHEASLESDISNSNIFELLDNESLDKLTSSELQVYEHKVIEKYNELGQISSNQGEVFYNSSGEEEFIVDKDITDEEKLFLKELNNYLPHLESYINNKTIDHIKEIEVLDFEEISPEKESLSLIKDIEIEGVVIVSEKSKADDLINQVENSQEYLDFKEQIESKYDENVNAVDFMMHKMFSTDTSEEQAASLKKDIDTVLKVYPEMEKLVTEQSQKTKKEKRQSVLRNAIVDDLRKGENLNASPERMGEEVLDSLLSPLRIARKAWADRRQKEKKEKLSGISVVVDNQLYALKSYSKDYSELKLTNKITGETKNISNQKSINFIIDKPIELTELEKNVISKGKSIILNKETNFPIKVNLNSEKKITFSSLNSANYKNVVANQKGILKNNITKLKTKLRKIV